MYKKVVKHVGRKRPSSAGCEKRKKMTTEEFIEAVNAIDNWDEIKAYGSARGDVFLRTHYGDKDVDMEIAILGKHDTSWGIRSISQVTFPTKILKLMVELAESRAEDNKCVILNGKPRHGTCYYFTIDDRDGRLIPNTATDVSKLEERASFSSEVLIKRKLALTPELSAVVDLMTVTLERAIKLTEKSKHDNLD